MEPERGDSKSERLRKWKTVTPHRPAKWASTPASTQPGFRSLSSAGSEIPEAALGVPSKLLGRYGISIGSCLHLSTYPFWMGDNEWIRGRKQERGGEWRSMRRGEVVTDVLVDGIHFNMPTLGASDSTTYYTPSACIQEYAYNA